MRRIALLLTFVVVVVSGYLSFIGVARQVDVPREKITPDGGFSYAIPLQRSWAPGRLIAHPDSAEKPAASSLVVREDGRAISRAHSPLEDIRTLGNGRLSHRGKTVYFATSDNSDPRENGRHYEFEYHRFTKKRIFFGACIAFLLTLAWTDSVLALGWVAAIRRHPLFKAPHSYADAAWSPRRFVAHVFQYLGLYLVFVAAFSAWWSLESYDAPKSIAGGDQQLLNRFAYYKAHRDEFDLVFLGDSRTYCGIHPERIDPLLGSRSINLSSFTNWFPTQYAEAKQLAEIVPKGTTVVLTTGQINFSCIGKIQRVFPITIPTALRYSTMKIPQEGLWDNVAYHNPYLRFWAIRGEIRESFLNWARAQLPWPAPEPARSGRPAAVAAPAANPASLMVPTALLLVPPVNPLVLAPRIKDRPELPAEIAGIVRNYGSDPHVTWVDVSEDGDRITSVIVYYRGGGYYRIEVDHAFFREKQQGAPRAGDVVTEPDGTVTAPSPEPDCLGLFDLILEEFQRRGVKVIINEIEEAPYVFGSPEARRAFREVMRTSVRPKVESRGIPYVTTDLDRLQNDDYFDYNHLNSNGIEKYAPMLAAALRPLLQGLERDQP
jgi:hypothetical protein